MQGWASNLTHEPNDLKQFTLIHPGLHKTGTTFLQECVFADRSLFNPLLTHEEVHELLVAPHDLEFGPRAVLDLLETRRNATPNGVIDVVSSEILSGTMFYGSMDSARLAERLHTVLPHSKILLSVRSQIPWLLSVYLQYLKRGGRKSFSEFLTYSPEPGYHWFSISLLRFDRLAEKYAKLFGAENILVLPQELLQSNRPAFLRYLFDFAEVRDLADENSRSYEQERGRSPPLSGAALLRLANAFRSGPMNPEGPTFLSSIGNTLARLSYKASWHNDEATARLVREAEAHIDLDLGASNRFLQRYCPVNLREFGYEL